VQPICSACSTLLVRLPEGGCPRCGLPVANTHLLCGRCQRSPPEFDATLAPFVYTHPIREMVLSIKHAHGFRLLDWMADALADKLSGIQADCLVPAPLHTRRLAERGFNQSCELARRVAARVNMPLWRDALVRDVDTPKLSGMRGKERRRAVRGVFRCVEEFSERHVVVLDDVMTSGATLDEIARTLKQRGATKVTALVFARTLRLPGH
jgi:ComF family protein